MSDMVSEITNRSSIDQRPIQVISRSSRMRVRSPCSHLNCMLSSRVNNTITLVNGTKILAINTTPAMAILLLAREMIPERMVSSWRAPLT